MNLHLVGGFLGSGKTTAIIGAAKWLLAQGMLTEEGDEQLRAAVDAEVREAIAAEEHAPMPGLRSIVEQSRARSAVFDVITHGTAVELSVDAG